MPPKPSEKRTRVSSSEEEISAHVLVDDAILKDIQKKLEKLDMLDKINNQLSTIKHDITNIKSNVTELEKGLNAVNDDVAEMKESMKRKVWKYEAEKYVESTSKLSVLIVLRRN